MVHGSADKMAKYSEDQPRVPAGEHGGGEFAGGESGGTKVDSGSQLRVREAIKSQLSGGTKVKFAPLTKDTNLLGEIPFDPRIVESRKVWEVDVERDLPGNARTGVSNAAGSYNFDQRCISLSTSSASTGTTIHEYGHHLDYSWYWGDTTPYYGENFDIDKEKFENLRAGMNKECGAARSRNGIHLESDWQKTRSSTPAKLGAVSSYALANRKEWFAESFLSYVKNPTVLEKRCPATFAAIDGLVRGKFLKEKV
jgi:hypothetical protein